MRNIKLTIQYDGTRYAGWQSQKNALAIQDVMQGVIKKITGEKANLLASGRTDAGVHAKAQVANFRTRSKIPLKNLQMAMNSALPKDIVVCRAEEAPVKFNSQHHARSKLYRYTIVNGDFVDPFIRKFAAKIFYKLDIPKMRKAAGILIGRHDFRSFRTTDSTGERDTIRTIKKISIEKKENMIYIEIEADGFLYNMARNIVGTLIEAARGKIEPGRVKDILEKRDRRVSGPRMPAKGLCLINVKY